MKLFLIRIISLCTYTALGTFGLSTGLGIEPVKAAIISAVFPLILVLRATAKGFLNDGKLDQTEIDAAIHAGEHAE
jgi:hypothetical protein